jgi:S1-C subfamily serine protease
MHSRSLGVLTLAAMMAAPAQLAQRDPLTLRGPGAQIGATFRDPVTDSLPRRGGGAVVVQVQDKSPAAASGMRAGDVVTVFDGLDVRNSKDLNRLVAETPPGRTVNVILLRDGKPRALKVTPVPGR